ncbi:MAG: hypothetical protein ACREQI_08695 [Candidatus Binataceae bacterium]
MAALRTGIGTDIKKFLPPAGRELPSSAEPASLVAERGESVKCFDERGRAAPYAVNDAVTIARWNAMAPPAICSARKEQEQWRPCK